MLRVYNISNDIHELNYLKFNYIVDSCVDRINSGMVVGVPTDTVYGLIASPFSLKAMEDLIAIKRRPSNKSFALIVLNKNMILKYANPREIEVNIIDKLMPGPLTLILDSKDNIPCFKGKTTLAMRISNHKLILSIIQKLQHPIIATSMNISGEDEPLDKIEFCQNTQGKIDVLVIHDNHSNNNPSTIVRINENNEIHILRRGALDIKLIENVILNK